MAGKGDYLSRMVKKIGVCGQTKGISKLLFQKNAIMTRVKYKNG